MTNPPTPNRPTANPARPEPARPDPAYLQRVRDGTCFICALLDGHSDYRHHIVFEDADPIAFLNRYPTLLGYCLVGPKQHVESWLDDMSEVDFLRFQRRVRQIGRAIAATVPTERMYSMSLGSRDGHAHLHRHLAPLPPGVPYERQQFHAVMAENGLLGINDATQADLARQIARDAAGSANQTASPRGHARQIRARSGRIPGGVGSGCALAG